MWYFLLLLSVSAADFWPLENRILQLRNAAPRPENPPSYMFHLYNRYRKGRMPYSAANTVRSFFPTTGRLGNNEILVFNLTGVHPTEYVERVDLHLQSKQTDFKQSSRGETKKLGLQVDILDLSRPLRPKIETIPLSKMQTGGWQTLDLTDSIIACLEGEADQHRLVGVAVRGPDSAKAVSQPFLVLFSEDDDHLSIEELGRRTRPAADRRKRQVLDNELPDYSSEAALPAVQARNKYKSLDLPRPEARKLAKEKHKKRRRRKDRRLPDAWGKGWWRDPPNSEGDPEEDYEDEQSGDETICRRRKRIVSFEDIGWGDWIISPKTFDAAYCAGECPHPLKKKVQSSNHAAIQSLVESLGFQEDVPGLCCVPESLSPVSLLYYDENKNIVLKSYPNMSVQSCSCR